MKQKHVFARARPAQVSCSEVYHFSAVVSNSPSLHLQQEPRGRIDLRIPYDGHMCFGHDALEDVKHQLGGRPVPGQLDALIGHLGFRSYRRTDLDSVLGLTAHNDVIPLNIPVLDNSLTSLHQLRTDQHECRISYAYRPEPPDLLPIHIDVSVFDERSLPEESLRIIGPDVESVRQELVEELTKRVGFYRHLVLKFEVQLNLPNAAGMGNLPPRLEHVGLEWPRTTSHRALSFFVGANRADEHLAYNPDRGEVEWGGVALRDVSKPITRLGLRSYATPPMWLFITQPGDLYRRKTLRGSLAVRLPNVLLSGVKPVYFDACGNWVKDDLVKLNTSIGVDMVIYIEDCFGARTLSPCRHLQFQSVVLDDVRVEDIVTLLEDCGFDVSGSAELPAEHEEEYRFLIVGKKLEGAGQMHLWLLADGERAETLQETTILGFKPFTPTRDTGNVKIYMRGQLKGDSQRLNAVMNDIQMSLKRRLGHASTLE